MPKKVEISHRTIVFTVVFLLLIWFLFYIKDIILELFVALLIMAVLNPLVTKLSKYKIPRALSVLVVYLMLMGVVAISIAAVVPALVEQTTSFVNNLPKFLGNLGATTFFSEQLLEQLVSQLGSLPSRFATVVVSLFSNVLGVVAVLVFAFYLLSERNKLDTQLGTLFGDKKKAEVGKFIDKLESKLGSWARGQLALMFIVGFASYIGLRLLGIPFALPLSILVGLLEIVPYIGPIIAAIPAVAIGFGISPVLGLATTALAFLVQQLESYVFTPKIMQKSAGVNPIVTLLSLAIGFRLAGIVGLIISVPIFITIQLLSKEYLLKN
jgi:predicted PurR-regulated permease PerM